MVVVRLAVNGRFGCRVGVVIPSIAICYMIVTPMIEPMFGFIYGYQAMFKGYGTWGATRNEAIVVPTDRPKTI